ncbi:hypothetical protein AK830_g4052 [Neonectria ditissima]|uniref:Uncharacterized protein n=1 Tax=Neonectria ditissima TaxID=78410 RepID=A0A0P7BPK9_9HYPO|nr:hypothetical protein AK830_g4052 [Neonectria ditissima]
MDSQINQDRSETISMLESPHKDVFSQALMNILSTDLAEFTYAQILDGLPTVESFRESYVWMEGHPVYELDHTQLCEGFLEKARQFRDQFDLLQLAFKKSLLVAFQNTTPGTKPFHLRLIEMVVVACHQIGAYLYELDDGIHKHQLHQDWRDERYPLLKDGMHPDGYTLPHTAFFHIAYHDPDQYPRGLADVAGYWAEGKIFGGVFVFDRGETDQESFQCKDLWIHGARARGPSTLYPPTPEQFNSLVNFLLADTEARKTTPFPLPIHGTSQNIPRWRPYEAFVDQHIFRDRYERKLPAQRPEISFHRLRNVDWPELGDEMYLLGQYQEMWQGLPYDVEGVAAAQERLTKVTPSSPVWNKYGKSD